MIIQTGLDRVSKKDRYRTLVSTTHTHTRAHTHTHTHMPAAAAGRLKMRSGKCDTVKKARVENAGVEKLGADRRGGNAGVD